MYVLQLVPRTRPLLLFAAYSILCTSRLQHIRTCGTGQKDQLKSRQVAQRIQCGQFSEMSLYMLYGTNQRVGTLEHVSQPFTKKPSVVEVVATARKRKAQQVMTETPANRIAQRRQGCMGRLARFLQVQWLAGVRPRKVASRAWC